MVRALGIDPGTMSFDLVLIEEDKIIWEKSISTKELAHNPEILIKSVKEAGDLSIIAGPSGYGTPVVCNKDIIDPEIFAREILLLTSAEEIEKGIRRGELGIAVYKALVDIVIEFWRKQLPVCYIPSVILLPTIPIHRKFNKIDMGTADKLAVTILGIHDHCREYGFEYENASFILVEMGFGYNAVIGVENGLIVDGYGGTYTPMGFLTIGPIDSEVVVAGKNWVRSDVFYGGISTICKTLSINEALEKRREDPLCNQAFEAMYENLYKIVVGMAKTLDNPREIILSGRLIRYKEIYDEIVEKLDKILPVRRMKGLYGARISKEAGQGYALIAEGLANGYFKELVNHTKILEARGTVMDWVVHPRLINIRKKLVNAYKKSVKQDVYMKIIS